MLRRHIAANHDALRKIIGDRKRTRLLGGLHGDEMKRAPKGFLPGDPAEDLLRRKMYIYFASLPPEDALKDGIVREISSRFEAMTPLLEFLNQPLLKRPRM